MRPLLPGSYMKFENVFFRNLKFVSRRSTNNNVSREIIQMYQIDP